jgi:lysozyme family protein
MAQRPTPALAALTPEYRKLWDTVQLDPGARPIVAATARRILANKPRYQVIERRTRVPWWWIGIIHNLESGLRFDRHLHNGDPLTDRTVQVPAGRPPAPSTPPFTFEESAIDALLMKGLDKVSEWTIERALYEAERYNGWGYRQYHPGELTPYLWSKTNHNDGTGKYVADGKWSESAPSEGQSGFAALLTVLIAMDPEGIKLRGRPAGSPARDVGTTAGGGAIGAGTGAAVEQATGINGIGLAVFAAIFIAVVVFVVLKRRKG